MPVVIALGTAFLLGLVHAIEVDHMIAVTAFVSTRPALAGGGRFWRPLGARAFARGARGRGPSARHGAPLA